MPTGRYRCLDGAGRHLGWEAFRAAPGPAGWRYWSEIERSEPEPHHETVDLTVDAGWRPVRLRIDTGAHQLILRATPDGRLEATLDGRERELPAIDDPHVDYLSPCFNAVSVQRLQGSSDIEVLWLDPFTCEPRHVRQRYERLGEGDVRTPVGTFRAERWRYTALETGWTRPLWVAGDTVVAYEGVFELAEYEPGAHGAVPSR